jgi:hypothetical protein
MSVALVLVPIGRLGFGVEAPATVIIEAGWAPPGAGCGAAMATIANGLLAAGLARRVSAVTIFVPAVSALAARATPPMPAVAVLPKGVTLLVPAVPA